MIYKKNVENFIIGFQIICKLRKVPLVTFSKEEVNYHSNLTRYINFVTGR